MSEENLPGPSFNPLEGIEENRKNDGSTSLADLPLGDGATTPFASVSDALRSQQRRDEGVWVPCPLFKGSRFRVGHIRACFPERQRLERLYRQERGIPLEQELSDGISEQLWERSFFNTVLFSWKGVPHSEGREFAVSFENHLLLMSIDEFKDWLSKTSADNQTFRDRFDEEAEKN